MMRYLLNLLLVVIFAACSPAITSTPPIPSLMPSPPSAKSLTLGNWHDVTYHEQVGRVILVNGGPETGKSPSEPLELWSWDGEKWSLLSADPNGPRWRNFASVSYDSKRNVLVLYGGLQVESQSFEETWEWDGQTWKQHATQGPGPRESAGMAYDNARERVVLFGGAQSGKMMNDTWEWDGSQWTQVSTEGPSARFPAGFVYDVAHQNVVLFGGHVVDAQGITTYGDTWTWDGTSWQEITSEGPSPRDGADAVFTQDSNQILLFGGAEIGSDVTLLNDTWLWNGNQWARVETEGPPARVHPAMAFDAARGKIVMTGGSNAPSTVLSDTWEWDGQTWTCVQGCN
jgi:hypothetical protein